MEQNPYESPRNELISNAPKANLRRPASIVFLALVAFGCGVVAAVGFVAVYPWSENPHVNPFAQALAMLLSMAVVGSITTAAVTVLMAAIKTRFT
jgi:amino acid transporter